MGRKRSAIPHLVVKKETIRTVKGRLPRSRHKPLCSECFEPTRVVPLDHGHKKKKPRRGRPPKEKPPEKPRRERIGYWCVSCQIFYYLDGSPLYQKEGV